ncbi:hypothetical protein AN958_07326 [Leucoagaricus sp. SymC.cos]|nr:hypothetical protein AN958_07326 [Leucoagaricus sp. SymC.cos]
MTIHSAGSSIPNRGYLPQHGFNADTNFRSLVLHNPFLFRVYTPKERSPFFDDTDPYFLAPKFNDRYARSPVEIRNHQQFIDEWNLNYADVAKHMEWTTRIRSPFISTSLSFAWCIWDALRRFHQGVKKDVQVAIIDGRTIADRAATAVELLELSSPHERNKEYWKWHRFSTESQSVLVHGSIPGTAVLASIPLLAILRHLPSYFLRPGFHALSAENPLIGIGWDYMEKKSTFRRFCRDMSNGFHSLDTEERLADSTAGSLALALAFLRPWFHRTVDVDCDQAVQTLVGLASIIAQWPGQPWVHERPEIHDLTLAMALTLCQELREKHGLQMKGEVSRLQGVVDELHEVVREYEVKFNSWGKRTKANYSRKPAPTLFINPHVPVFSPPVPIRVQTPLTPPDTPKSSSSTSWLAVPSASIGRSTETRDVAADPSLHSGPKDKKTSNLGIPTTPLTAAAAASINAIASQSLTPPTHHEFSDIASIPSDTLTPRARPSSIALTPPFVQPQHPHTPFFALSDIRPEEIPLPPSPLQHDRLASVQEEENLILSPSSFADDDSWTIILSQTDDFDSDSDDHTQVDEDVTYRKELHDSVATLRESSEVSPPGSPTLVMAPLPAATSPEVEGFKYLPPRPRSGIFSEPLEFDYTQIDTVKERFRRPTRFLETAGCLVTGFLVGAFITVAIFSPQRRMIIHLT